jgi:succinoglycan biosynthesis transport protein ExoP
MKFDDIRLTPGIENIWIISSGKLPANPVEVLDAKGMPDLIQKLKSQFDVILFDSPPVLPVTDASILASKVDCTVIVYEIGRTSREALMRTKMQLESIGPKVAGVILNNTRPQTEAISSYPYYYHYKYKYYGKEETEKEQQNKKENKGV